MGSQLSKLPERPVNASEVNALPQGIRAIILSLLSECKVPYVVKPYDQALHDECLAVCKERGYAINPQASREAGSYPQGGEKPSLLPFLPSGVYLASIIYGHFETDMERLVYIALYSSSILYLDDLYKRDVDSVSLFSKRLMRGEKQGHAVLDGLVDLLNRAETHFGSAASNLIMYDTIGYVSSLLLDCETQRLKWSNGSVRFPYYMRILSGLASAYVMFLFPLDMPITSYIQAIPEIGYFITYVNDVLSFYKEELRGEEDNYISLMSASQGTAKLDILQKLADNLTTSADRIDKMLEADPAALKAWTGFKSGCFHYHISNTRYKLDQLNL